MANHGLSKTKAYRVHAGIIQRCYNSNNPGYKHYGGRGIKMCDEWRHNFHSFHKWLLDNGWDENKSKDEQTIDRIDVNGDYEPDNCRLIPMREQYFNRTDNHYITAFGITKSIKKWSEENGISQTVINYRIRDMHWSPEQAVSKKPRKMKNRAFVIVDGKKKTLSEISKEHNIPISTLSVRFHRSGITDYETLIKKRIERNMNT